MANLPYNTRDLIWIGDSRKQLAGFPKAAKGQFGTALRMVQNGATPRIAKPITGFGSGVYELKVNTSGDTYRVVYLVKMKKGVYVADAFQKKSKTGRVLAKEDRERLRLRVKQAQQRDR